MRHISEHQMTSKERMLVAISHGQPDTVPVAPDISGMLPTKRAGNSYGITICSIILQYGNSI